MRSIVKHSTRPVSIFDDFDRMFNSFFNDSTFEKRTSPRVDIRENEDGYVLEAELPGLSEKDIEVKIDDNLLTVSSKLEEENSDESDGYILRERRNASFSRSFVLPKDVDRKSIEARFANGLLILTLAKAPETKPKTIEVKSAK